MGANFRTAKNRHEAQAEESRRGQFGDLVVGLKESTAIYFRRGPTKSAMASAMTIFLGIILLAGAGTMPYWQRSKNYLSRLTVKWGAIAQQGPSHTSEPEVRVESAKAQPAAPLNSLQPIINLFNLTVEKSLSREPSLGKAQVILLTQR